jgi:large subunit ribosomal protein L35
MPKMKSHRGALKRFKKTGNKIKRGSAFRSHILTKKNQKRVRRLKKSNYISKSDLLKTKTLLVS